MNDIRDETIVVSDESERRKASHIEWQREVLATPAEAPFECAHEAHRQTIDLLATIAASQNEYADAARAVLLRWRQSFATEEEMQLLQTHADLEMCVPVLTSRATPVENGAWLLTWSWINYPPTEG